MRLFIKLIISVIFSAASSVFFFWFSNYYLSKQKSEDDKCSFPEKLDKKYKYSKDRKPVVDSDDKIVSVESFVKEEEIEKVSDGISDLRDDYDGKGQDNSDDESDEKEKTTQQEIKNKGKILKTTHTFSSWLITLISVVFMIFGILNVMLSDQKQLSVLITFENQLFWYGIFLIAFIDLRVKKIPNKIILGLICMRAIFILISAIFNPEQFLSVFLLSVIGFLVGGVIMLIFLFLSRGGIGAGDVKMFAVLGLFYGFQGLIPIMLYSLIIAAVTGILLLISRKAKMKSTLPMAPFALIGLTVFLILI